MKAVERRNHTNLTVAFARKCTCLSPKYKPEHAVSGIDAVNKLGQEFISQWPHFIVFIYVCTLFLLIQRGPQ